MYQPLADQIRPLTLDDMVGQSHLIGKAGILRRIIESGQIPNMIFYGPSGVGKTTLAGIISAQTNRKLYRLNATTASLSDIKAIVEELDTFLAPQGALLYLDEIQYFNKKQQQSLLEFMENGKITLIASTTENPYFYIYNALLSRSTIFEFKPASRQEAVQAARRAFSLCAKERRQKISLEDGAADAIAQACGGDVRKSINAVELLCAAAQDDGQGGLWIALADAKAVAQASSVRYDRQGDDHYDLLSAFHKSLRGSDPDAALYYLARLLLAGDMLSAIRRLLACVSEDVGLAYPQAAVVVKACVDSALQLGLPEAKLPLAQAALVIATAPKSDSVAAAIGAAWADAEQSPYDPPAYLKDAHYAGAPKLGRGLTYQYPHNFPNNWVDQPYLPDQLKGSVYYRPSGAKLERQAQAYWQKVKDDQNHK